MKRNKIVVVGVLCLASVLLERLAAQQSEDAGSGLGPEAPAAPSLRTDDMRVLVDEVSLPNLERGISDEKLLSLMHKYATLGEESSAEMPADALPGLGAAIEGYIIAGAAPVIEVQAQELRLLASELGVRLREGPFSEVVANDNFSDAEAAALLLYAERQGYELYRIIKDDNRTDVLSPAPHLPAGLVPRANSVFLVLKKRDFKDPEKGFGEIKFAPYERFYEKHPGENPNRLPLCRTVGLHQKFHDQPILGYCTAFLVSGQRLVTAAHCIGGRTEYDPLPREISNIRFIRQFYGNGAYTDPYERPASEVWKIKKLEARYYKKSGKDYAVVSLDRNVNSQPLTIDAASVPVGAPVHMLGHPMGMPMKYVGDAVVTNNSLEDNYLATLDAFMGNSGSPVFSSQGAVIGLLTGGYPDFKQATEEYPAGSGQTRTCLFESYCNENNCTGEVLTRIAKLPL